MAQRQYRSEQYQYEEYSPKEKPVAYQAYQASKPNKERVKELVFFVNIVLFSLMTVLSAYVYLSMDIPVFFAFLLAIVTGVAGLRLVQFGLKKKFKPKKIQPKK